MVAVKGFSNGVDPQIMVGVSEFLNMVDSKRSPWIEKLETCEFQDVCK